MPDANAYPVRLFKSEEDGGFIAEAIDLPGCSAFGETMDDACRELQNAIRAWIAAAEEVDNPVPAPSARDVAADYSGRVALRCSKSLHAALSVQAEHEGVSLNSYIVSGLTEYTSGFTARRMAITHQSDGTFSHSPKKRLAKN